MGDILSSHKNSQSTTNQQVGVNGANASGASGTLGKGAAQAVGQGISLVLNTGGNKVSNSGGNGGGGRNRNRNNAPSPDVQGTPGNTHNSTSNQAGGNIAVSIQQTDEGAVAGALDLAKSANDSLLQATTNAFTLAAHALQTGADVAAVAIPTYAAQEIASNAIQPNAPTIIDTGSGQPSDAAPSNKNFMLLAAVAVAIGLLAFTPKRHA